MGTLGSRIHEKRKEITFTQKQVARVLNIGENAFVHYEKDRRKPTIEKLIQLAILFHTSIQYLVTGMEAKKDYDEENVTPFSERVKELRKKNHLTQKQAAAELGIRYTAYQAYEYGKSEPNLEHLQQLADLFDVTLDELMGRNEK